MLRVGVPRHGMRVRPQTMWWAVAPFAFQTTPVELVQDGEVRLAPKGLWHRVPIGPVAVRRDLDAPGHAAGQVFEEIPASVPIPTPDPRQEGEDGALRHPGHATGSADGVALDERGNHGGLADTVECVHGAYYA